MTAPNTMSSARRPLAGLTLVLAITIVLALAASLFQGKLTPSEPLTVLAERAGLVMNPGAKVQLLGVQVGKVSSIETLADGQVALHLAIDPAQLEQIPSNVTVDISAPTVFGAKSVQLVPPETMAEQTLSPGSVIDARRVTVEINTIFEQLTTVLAAIDPAKLNQTLGAIASAFDGRGEGIGRALQDLNSYLAALEPSLPNLAYDLEAAPTVVTSYADAAQDLLAIADGASAISTTVVEEQRSLDAILVSVTGLAEIGTDVVTANSEPLTELLQLLIPTTALTDAYHPALTCALKGLIDLQNGPPLPYPGVVTLSGLILGRERYRYPMNLPKVAATGGPHCADLGLPVVPPNWRPPTVVADDGADPTAYGNQGILLNSDALKQWLFGPIPGPPRNTAQIGQPG